MNSHKQILLYTVAIIVLICITAAVSYAYIGAAQMNGDVDVNVGIYEEFEGVSISYQINDVTSGIDDVDEISFRALVDDLTIEDADENFSEHEYEIVVTADFDENFDDYYGGVDCEYELIYTPIVPYIPSSGATAAGLDEYGISACSVRPGVSDEAIIDNATEPIILNGQLCLYKDFWYSENYIFVRTTFYNLNVDQSSATSSNASGTLTLNITSCEGTWLPE